MQELTPADGRSQSRHEFEKAVLLRAHADPAFRRQLLTDPRAALQAAFSVDIPAEVEIQAIAETPSRFFIVLPADAEELSDAELAQVAGGTSVRTALMDYFSPLQRSKNPFDI